MIFALRIRILLVVLSCMQFLLLIRVDAVNYITYIDRTANTSHQIELQLVEGVEILNILDLFRLVQADVEWDYVTGLAHVRYMDHHLKFSEGSSGYQDGDRFETIEGRTVISEGGLYLPCNALPSVVDDVFEGGMTWDKDRYQLVFLGRPSESASKKVTRTGKHLIVLDAGHGGSDTGIRWPGNRYEKDVTRRLCERVGQILMDRLGAEVVLTRPGDYDVPAVDRINLANASKADILVSIHLARPEEIAPNGFIVYTLVPSVETDPEASLKRWDSPNSQILKKSSLVAGKFGAVLAVAAAGTMWDLHTADMIVLRGLTIPGFVVEISTSLPFYGGISLDRETGESRAAEAIFDGIKAILETSLHADAN